MIKLMTMLALLIAPYIPKTLQAQTCTSAYALPHPIKMVCISYADIAGTATLYGSGETYITDLKVEVKFENYTPYEIVLEDGYSAYIETFDFGAVFKPDGFMTLTNNSAQNTLDVYVGYMDESFYNRIFAPDGSVRGEQPYVNDVSFVSPSLNPATGTFRLITYRSVAAVAEVNRLGYIIQTLDFDGNEFQPTFTEFSIRL